MLKVRDIHVCVFQVLSDADKLKTWLDEKEAEQKK